MKRGGGGLELCKEVGRNDILKRRGNWNVIRQLFVCLRLVGQIEFLQIKSFSTSFWSQLKHAFGRECARYWSKRFNFPCRKWGQCPAALSAAIKKAFAGIQFSLPVKTSFNPPTMPRYFVRRSRILIPRLIGDFLCQIGYSLGQVIPVHDLQR